MAEVQFPEVKDRNVATPSRVRLTKAVGIEDDSVFDVEAVPGTVYEEGTPLNKEFFDKLKLYMDNNVGSPDNPVPITNGGTGANSVEGARTNLDVYSTIEVDEIVERAGAKIDPHINSKVTDTPEGVHGVYIDDERRIWTDPDGDGSFTDEVHAVDDSTITYEGENPKLTAHVGAMFSSLLGAPTVTKEEITVTGTPNPSALVDANDTSSTNGDSYNIVDYVSQVVTKLNNNYYVLFAPYASNIDSSGASGGSSIGYLVCPIAKITKEGVVTIHYVHTDGYLSGNAGYSHNSSWGLCSNGDKLILAGSYGTYSGNYHRILLSIIDPSTMHVLYTQYRKNSVGTLNMDYIYCGNGFLSYRIHALSGVNLGCYGTTWMSSCWRTGDADIGILYKLTEAGVSSFSTFKSSTANKFKASSSWVNGNEPRVRAALISDGTYLESYANTTVSNHTETQCSGSPGSLKPRGSATNFLSVKIDPKFLTVTSNDFDFDTATYSATTKTFDSVLNFSTISKAETAYPLSNSCALINDLKDVTDDDARKGKIRTKDVTTCVESNLLFMFNSDKTTADVTSSEDTFNIQLNENTFLRIPLQNERGNFTVQRLTYE